MRFTRLERRVEKEKDQYERKIRKGIPDETAKKVPNCCENDQTSRMLPGIKDNDSLEKNLHYQKQPLLGSVWELHNIFQCRNPTFGISYFKFWSLKPKWCVSPESSGTLKSMCLLRTSKRRVVGYCI